MASKTLIFVYGSLKRGERHHGQMAGADFIGIHRTSPGYRLVSYLDGYPALVRAASEQGGVVSGEVYRLTAAMLARLDEFEDCPHAYQRQPIELESGDAAEAYVITAERAAGLPILEAYGSQAGATDPLAEPV